MKSNTYYGEYTLKHWIKLLITRNITLPDYQRSFVWETKDIRQLIKSISEGQFIQPVTIARYSDGINPPTNLILDGQQRLTSILISYLCKIPDRTRFNNSEVFAGEDDSANDEQDDDVTKLPMGWTFLDMLNNFSIDGNDIVAAKNKVLSTLNDKYNSFDIDGLDNSFFEEHYIGFSYIIPDVNADRADTDKFFSHLFRNMNYLGMKLSPVESRRSLYYTKKDLHNFFDGIANNGKHILCNIRIKEQMTSGIIDVVRYLSTLSQYAGNGHNLKKVLLGYSAYSSREQYYADYVSFIMGLEQSYRADKFGTFDFDAMLKNTWERAYSSVYTFINTYKHHIADRNDLSFTSWIDADYWLFGLFYMTLFERKTVIFSDELRIELNAEIAGKRSDFAYSKSPNLLGRIRERIGKSIEIYRKYAE